MLFGSLLMQCELMLPFKHRCRLLCRCWYQPGAPSFDSLWFSQKTFFTLSSSAPLNIFFYQTHVHLKRAWSPISQISDVFYQSRVLSLCMWIMTSNSVLDFQLCPLHRYISLDSSKHFWWYSIAYREYSSPQMFLLFYCFYNWIHGQF